MNLCRLWNRRCVTSSLVVWQKTDTEERTFYVGATQDSDGGEAADVGDKQCNEL